MYELTENLHNHLKKYAYHNMTIDCNLGYLYKQNMLAGDESLLGLGFIVLTNHKWY